jgi:hypothetical protein
LNGTNLPAATVATLALTNVAMSQAGEYSVVITNIAGSVISSTATLSVYDSVAPSMASQGYGINGEFQLIVTGVPGYSYIVQASTNLLDWTPVQTNVSPFSFTDVSTTNYPNQFYRAVYVP